MLEAYAALGIVYLPYLVALAAGVLVALVATLSFPGPGPKFVGATVVIAIGSSDVLVAGRHLVADVLLYGPILLAYVTQALRPRGRGTARRRVDSWGTLWVIFCAYMVVQALRGVIFWEDVTKIRWILFWIILAITPSVLSSIRIPARDLTKSVLIGCAVYYVTFFSLLLIDESLIRGSNAIFVSSQFPILVGIPAALISLECRYPFRKLAMVVLALALVSAIALDSRAAMLVAFVLAVLPMAFTFRARAVLPALLVILTALWWASDTAFVERMTHSANALSVYGAGGRPAYGDQDRIYKLEAAFEVTTATPHTTLVGYGLTTSGRVAADTIVSVFVTYLPRYDIATELGAADNVLLTGFGSWMVDTGFIGVGFLVLRGASLSLAISRQGRRSRVYLVLVPLLAIAWTTVHGLLFLFPFWLLLMPNGLLEQWSRALADEPARAALPRPVTRPRTVRLQPAPFPVDPR